MQTTLTKNVTFSGCGLHTGLPVTMIIKPAAPGHGLIFRRTDCDAAVADIRALWDHVEQTALCTKLVNEACTSLSTTEHVLAALAGCGINNALIEIDGPEVPISDGSSAEFVKGILSAGIKVQDAPIKALKILKPVEVARGDAVARLTPRDSLLIEFEIDFDDPAIGIQKKQLNMSNGSFIRELSNSRTFCQMRDVTKMHENGLALGGSLENAVVVEDGKVLSPGGLRHPDEAVRHKMLDALGDLALAGYPVLGHYHGQLAGHALTNELLRQVFSDPSNYEIVTCDDDTAALLPGAGVHLGELPERA